MLNKIVPLYQFGTFEETVGPPKTSPPLQQTPRNVEAEERALQQKKIRESLPIFEPIDTDYSCNSETLLQFMHADDVPGMHLFCVEQKDERTRTLSVYKNLKGKLKKDPTPENKFSASHIAEMEVWTWESFHMALNATLTLPLMEETQRQGWALFTPTGDRILSEDTEQTAENDKVVVETLPKLGMFLLTEGGQWVWPGVHRGFKRTIALDDNNNATLETLSLEPLVLSVEGFLTVEECDLIQEKAAPKMKYSSVTLMDKDKGRPSSDFRTSQSTFLNSRGGPELKAIDDRTASLVRIPRMHQEYAQVLKYEKDEKYDTHLDYFDPAMYQNDARTLQTIQNGRRNRMATVFWYLTDVEEGGETVFPRSGGKPHPEENNVSYGGCDDGLKVKPQRGKVIIFYSMTADGVVDPFSLHGACPVKQGTKWAANKWIWNEAMNYLKE